jgi:hypothetical protein
MNNDVQRKKICPLFYMFPIITTILKGKTECSLLYLDPRTDQPVVNRYTD